MYTLQYTLRTPKNQTSINTITKNLVLVNSNKLSDTGNSLQQYFPCHRNSFIFFLFSLQLCLFPFLIWN